MVGLLSHNYRKSWKRKENTYFLLKLKGNPLSFLSVANTYLSFFACISWSATVLEISYFISIIILFLFLFLFRSQQDC